MKHTSESWRSIQKLLLNTQKTALSTAAGIALTRRTGMQAAKPSGRSARVVKVAISSKLFRIIPLPCFQAKNPCHSREMPVIRRKSSVAYLSCIGTRVSSQTTLTPHGSTG